MKRLITPIALAAVALVLAGCAPALPSQVDGTSTQAPQPTASASPSDSRTVAPRDCSGEIVLNQPGDYDFDGNCGSILIEGTGIRVDLDDADGITIRGDGNEVDADNIARLEINGNGNDIDADDIGELVFNGNDNEVDGDDIGSVTDNGQGNRIDD